MFNTIEYQGSIYPEFQAKGNASQFALPFAKHFCQGFGVDIGFCQDDWKYPDAIGADINDTSNDYHANNLPANLDYIYSSHCLEHLDDWVASLEYWVSSLKDSGVLFLYLPHPDQEYWKPWNNRKHKHLLYPKDVEDCLRSFGVSSVMRSERDLNHSYIVVARK